MISQQFQGRGLALMADVGGDPADPAAVFLHGGGQTRHAWGAAARTLVDAGHYVVSLDLRGHGDSDWAPDGDYSLAAHVEDLLAVLRQMPSKPTLIGASLGGLTSLVAVGESDEQLASSLVLVDVTPRLVPEGMSRVMDFMKAHAGGFTTVIEAAEAVAAYLPHRVRPADPSGLQRNLRLRDDGRYYWHWDPAMFDVIEPEQQRFDRCEAAARQVRIPTLLVRGALSELVDEESVRHLLEVIPSAVHVDVADASHMVAGDRNDMFSTAVLDFLRQRIALGQPT